MGGHYVKMRDVGDIIWEGDNPPNPIGDYKLWYSTDTLELYFHYCDANGAPVLGFQPQHLSRCLRI